MGVKNQLSDEMKQYGYVFSWKKSVAAYGGMLCMMALLGRFFQLQWQYILLLCVIAVMLSPFFARNTAKSKYEQQRFSELNIYMEQFLYSFQKSKKILTTLEDVEKLFGQGRMKTTINKAREFIMHTYSRQHVEREGLQLIEKEYSCKRLETIHKYALWVERNGGDCENGILLLLEARRMWADSVYLLMKEKKKQRFNVILSIVASLLLCSMIYLITSRMDFSIMDNPISQLLTTIVLVLDLVIYYQVEKRFSQGYVLEEAEDDGEAYRQYQRYCKYNSKHLIQRLGKQAAQKRVTRAMEIAFPQWLMQLALLLQTENVQVALVKSFEASPKILQLELKELIYKLQKSPSAMEPYMEFLQEFTLPEVKASMKMLYSISEGCGGEAQSQIRDMIQRNQQLLDKANRMKNEDALAGMYLLFLAPQLTAGVKMVADLMVLMILYMANMGGV